VQDDIRASLDDLAIRWETPKGRDLKKQVILDARNNGGRGIPGILKDFMYVKEVPHGSDLRCVTLDGENLSDCTFGKVDMSWASLAGANLSRCDLRKSNLKRANMSKADLSMARMENTDCSRGDFTDATMDGAHFKEAKMNGAIFIGADVQRASFDSCNLAKANFSSAKVDQANFFNADCNNANFDSGALERIAAQPAKAWGLRWDMDKDDFEREVGLKSMTSRATKKFKGLDVLLQQVQALKDQMDGGQAGAAPKSPIPPPPKKKSGGDMVFGATLRGTRKLRPVSDEPDFVARTGPEAGKSIPKPERRPPPPRTNRMRPQRPGGPPTGPQRRPTGPQRSPTGAQRRAPTGQHARPGGPPSGTGRRPGPPRRGPGGPPTGPQRPQRPAPPPPPPLPIAAFETDGPEPIEDWAKVIGQLMQLKDSLTQIVVEIDGESSRILYKRPSDD
jgi:pentapeptide repeat protein